jgi:hypothetical protein
VQHRQRLDSLNMVGSLLDWEVVQSLETYASRIEIHLKNISVMMKMLEGTAGMVSFNWSPNISHPRGFGANIFN